ncbi:MAG TPA: O-antigen ligase family protein [Thermoanaerobaculia bacterium]|nr:O-antigen ligase family protein [Thermoanaerobaculia bacterium]
MSPETRRTILRHAVAIDLVITASGVALLTPNAPAVTFFAFVAAVALSAWLRDDEAGLAATAYSVITLAIFFREQIDVTTLTVFAATGAAVSAFSRAARRVRQEEQAAAVPVEAAPAPAVPAVPLPIGVPLLVVILYADVSDSLMTQFPLPSLLRPIILLLAIVAFKYRRVAQPMNIALQLPVIFLVLYAVAGYASGIWARNLRAVDGRFSEFVKATFICILAASLIVSWQALRRALLALIGTAAAMSAVSLIQVTTGKLENFLGGMVAVQSGNIYGQVTMPRASGPPVSDPNFYARILLVGIPLAAALAINERRRGRKLAYWALAALITGGTLVTYSRGAMFAVFAMCGLMVLALRVRPRHMFALALAGIAVIAMLPRAMSERVLTVEALVSSADQPVRVDSSVAKRKLLYGVAIRMFDEHLIGGVGAGNFNQHYDTLANQVGMAERDWGEPGSPQFPHGLYFEIASETGLLGLLTFLGAAGAAFLYLWGARRRLLARGETGRAAIASGIGVALAGYLMASVFLHESHVRYFGLYVGLAVAVARLAQNAQFPGDHGREATA